MICTSVIPYLSSGLARNTKNFVHVCPVFPTFYHFESLAFFSKTGGQSLHRSSQAGCFKNFSKVYKQLNNNFSKKRGYILTKSEDKPKNRYISKTFTTKNRVFVGKIAAF